MSDVNDDLGRTGDQFGLNKVPCSKIRIVVEHVRSRSIGGATNRRARMTSITLSCTYVSEFSTGSSKVVPI